MTFVAETYGNLYQHSTTDPLIVPDGVLPQHTGLLIFAGSSPVPTSTTLVCGGATITELQPAVAMNNMFWNVFTISGVTAGDQYFYGATNLIVYSHTWWTGPISMVGPQGTRTSSAPATYTLPSVTVPADSTLMFLNTERRSSGTSEPITITDSAGSAVGVTEVHRAPWTSPGSTWTNIYLASLDLPAGDTGVTTVVATGAGGSSGNYVNQFFLEGPDAAPVAPEPTVLSAFTSRQGTDYLRTGWITKNISSLRMVLSSASDLSSPTYSDPVTVGESGWSTAKVSGLTPNTTYYMGIEADGVLLDTGRLKAQTLTTEPLSYVALTGSCQATGSANAVFTRMMDENAVFLAHQGDLHYSDTTDQSVWRAGLLSSMSSATYAPLMASVGMNYVYDNHDWAGQPKPDSPPWSSPDPAEMYRELSGDYEDDHALYSTWVHGRVRWIKLDQWSERSLEDAPEDASKVCISATQEAWLLNLLETATEPIIVLLTSWPMYANPFIAAGRWGSYATQSNRIRDWITAHPAVVNRMICIGGDSHAVHADSGANNNCWGYMPSLNASAFDKAGGVPSGTWDIGVFDTIDGDGYYSRVTITDSPSNIDFLWEAVQGSDGSVIMSYHRKQATQAIWDGAAEQPAHVTRWDGTREVISSIEISS